MFPGRAMVSTLVPRVCEHAAVRTAGCHAASKDAARKQHVLLRIIMARAQRRSYLGGGSGLAVAQVVVEAAEVDVIEALMHRVVMQATPQSAIAGTDSMHGSS